MTSLRRQFLVWQIVSGVGILGLVLWSVLLPRTIGDKASVTQLVRVVPISFAVMLFGLIPSIVLLARHRELRKFNLVLPVIGIAMLAGVLALMIWYFILPGRLS